LLVLPVNLVGTTANTKFGLELQKLFAKLAQASRLFCGWTANSSFH